MIDQTISHYRITAKLGAGGMGEVYLGEDTKLKRKVALKFLPQSFTTDADARSRFQREAEALAALNHPNIVTVFDVSEYDCNPYITMEYIEGQSLKELVATGDLPIDRILDIVSQVADGLSAAHKREIIHRDIKSENIIVSSEGRVKIMDFGLATWRGVSKVTKEGSTVGTMAYMSPEQAQGLPVDHRTDLWSLGVILYEMVTRRVPFEGEHDAAITYSIVNETPHPLARYSADVPEELQRIVTKCLNKNRDERYQSASDLVADLRALRRSSSASGVPAARPSRKHARLIAILSVVGVAVIAVAVAFLTDLFRSGEEESTAERKMLAVLPFQNLGAEDQEYFADGVTEEITSRLASIGDLGVLARTSVLRYKNTTESIRTIGQELGVDYVLEGTIRWDQSQDVDRVRITPQLIRVDDEIHIWSEQYQRPLEDIFRVQSEIAQEVVSALNLVLLPAEQQALDVKPTENLQAYDLYLQGDLYRWRSDDVQTQLKAIDLYNEAIKRDSNFALAYAALAQCYLKLYWQGARVNLDPLAKAKAAIDVASALAPDAPDVHWVRADYFYHGFLDYEQALRECELALSGRPSHPFALFWIGAIKRRQGHWHESLEYMKQACKLDPRNARFAENVGISYISMRRYRESLQWSERAIAIYPSMGPFINIAEAYLLMGEIDTAKVSIEQGVEITGHADVKFWSAEIDFIARDFESAMAKLGSPPHGIWSDSVDYYLLKGKVYHFTGEKTFASLCFDSARTLLELWLPQDRGSQHVGRDNSRLGLALAWLGKKNEALVQGLRGTELMPISKSAVDGADRLEVLARIYTRVGEYDSAIDVLDSLLSIPHYISAARLRLEPSWDALRDHPRFQALIEKGHKVF